MALTIGAVLLAAFLVPPQRSGYLDVAGYRALRAASWAAAGWTAAAVLLVPLSLAEGLGRPVGDVLDLGLLFDLVPRLSAASAWTLTALVAVVVLVGCRTVLTWGWSVVLFGLALLGPLPVALTGHSAGRRSARPGHRQPGRARAGRVDVGGRPGRRARHRRRPGPGSRGGTVHRGPAVLPAGSGLLARAGRDRCAERPRADPARTCSSGPGTARWSWPRPAALLALGAAGAFHRRATVAPAARGEPRALLRLGGVEVLLMLATIGLAVALGRSAAPDTGTVPSRTEAIIGYDLAGPPTAGPAGVRLAVQPALRHGRDRAGRGLPARRCAGCDVAATAGRSAARWPGWPGASGCWSPPAPGSGATGRPCSACTWPST